MNTSNIMKNKFKINQEQKYLMYKKNLFSE